MFTGPEAILQLQKSKYSIIDFGLIIIVFVFLRDIVFVPALVLESCFFNPTLLLFSAYTSVRDYACVSFTSILHYHYILLLACASVRV